MFVYTLDEDHQPRQASWDEYAAWRADGFERTMRVGWDEVGEDVVSTVFLGLDHDWSGTRPILFETMTFGPVGQHQWRYATWDAAVAGHDAVVRALRAGASLDSLEAAR